MKVFFGGARGSYPVAEQAFSVYGGETTCVLVSGDAGERLVLDAGSGLRVVSARLAAEQAAADSRSETVILFSHYHIDHLIGLTALSQLYDSRSCIVFAAPRRRESPGLEAVIRDFLVSPYWPLTWEEMEATIAFTDLDGSSRAGWRHGGLQVNWLPLQHPGGCWAYRIDEAATGASLVFATDVEWALAPEPLREAFHEFCRTPSPARLLVMDAQFGAENYVPHRGWGHSTHEEVLAVAVQGGVARTLLTHHDPRRDDAQLAELESRLSVHSPPVALARQFQEVELP